MSKEYTRLLSIVPAAGLSPGSVLFDDFSTILRWDKTGGNGDEIFELDPTVALLGGQSLHMKTRTTDAAANDVIIAQLTHHLTLSRIFTFTAIFRITNLTYVNVLQFTLQLFDGVNITQGIITFTPATPKWEYIDAAENQALIPNSSFSINPTTWHRFSMTLNFTTGVYVSAFIDQLPLTLSNALLHSAADATLLSAKTRLIIQTVGTNPVEIWFDSINIAA